MTDLSCQCDQQYTADERKAFAADPKTARMLEEYPSGKQRFRLFRLDYVVGGTDCVATAGVHARPYIDNQMMAVWTYDIEPVPAHYPVEDVLDQRYGAYSLRCRLQMLGFILITAC